MHDVLVAFAPLQGLNMLSRGLNEGSYHRIPPSRLIIVLQESVVLIETDLIIGRCVSTDESPPSLVLAGHNCEENELFKSKQEALIYLQRNPPRALLEMAHSPVQH